MIDLIVGIGTLYLLWQQNQIFRQQNAIFAAQAGTVISVADKKSLLPMLRRYWPMLAMACLAVISWMPIAYGHWKAQSFETGDAKEIVSPELTDRQNKILQHLSNMEFDWEAYRYQHIIGRSYHQEKVLLDGREFDNCTFSSVTFVFEGTAPFRVNGYKVSGDIRMESNLPVVKSTFDMLSLVVQAKLTNSPTERKSSVP